MGRVAGGEGGEEGCGGWLRLSKWGTDQQELQMNRFPQEMFQRRNTY